MLNYKYFILFIFSIALALSSCRKDEEYIVNDPIGPTNITDVVGRVIGENGESLSGSTLVIGSETTTSDENGFFSIKGVNLGEDNVIIANRPDRFEVSRVITNPKSRNEILIQLLERTFVGKVSSATGGTIEFEGVKVVFPPLAFDTDASQFPGSEVNIFAKRLNPENLSQSSAIPGDLSGISSEQENVQLASYSMFALEIETEQGEQINLGEGITANVTFPVDDVLLANAPATIPLWHYDIAQGKWLEEGEAVMENGAYIGEVTHFSWWNCDAPFPVVKLNVTIVDTNNKPIPSSVVMIRVVDGGFTRYSITDTDGFICGQVPRDEALVLTVGSHFECLDFNTSVEINPLTENTTLPDIQIDLVSTGSSTLTATFLDCEENPLEDIYVQIFNADMSRFLYPDVDGSFYYEIPNCIESFNLIAYDFSNNTKSNTIEFPNGLDEDFQIDALSVCESNETYINVNIGEESYSHKGVFANGEIIYSVNPDSIPILPVDLYMGVPIDNNGFISGIQTPFNMRIQIGDPDNEGSFLYQLLCFNNGSTGSNCEEIELNLTTVGPKGDYIIGTFSGILYDEPTQNTPIQISGDFRAAHN